MTISFLTLISVLFIVQCVMMYILLRKMIPKKQKKRFVPWYTYNEYDPNKGWKYAVYDSVEGRIHTSNYVKLMFNNEKECSEKCNEMNEFMEMRK